MTIIIDSYRAILIKHSFPNFINLGLVLILSLIILFIEVFVFKKLEKNLLKNYKINIRLIFNK